MTPVEDQYFRRYKAFLWRAAWLWQRMSLDGCEHADELSRALLAVGYNVLPDIAPEPPLLPETTEPNP